MSSATPLPPPLHPMSSSQSEERVSSDLQCVPPTTLPPFSLHTQPAPSLTSEKAKEALIGRGCSSQVGKISESSKAVTEADINDAVHGDRTKAHILFQSYPLLGIIDTLR